jgi:ferrous iron transport protein A
MDLMTAQEGKEHIIDRVQTGDTALENFLFTLGCYAGEPITVIARRWGSCTVAIKDGRYNMDTRLAKAITVTALD